MRCRSACDRLSTPSTCAPLCFCRVVVLKVGLNGGALCFRSGLFIRFMLLSEVVIKDVGGFISAAEAERV